MSENEKIESMVASVARNLEKNGFPGRSVAFPLEKLYESAHERGINFNKVREGLRQRGIESELEGNRVIFFKAIPKNDLGFDLSDAFSMFESLRHNTGLMDQMRDAMANLSPDQLKEMSKMVPGLDAGAVSQFAKQFSMLSTEERQRAFDLAASKFGKEKDSEI